MHNWNYTMQLEINLTTDWITINHPQTIFLTFTRDYFLLYIISYKSINKAYFILLGDRDYLYIEVLFSFINFCKWSDSYCLLSYFIMIKNTFLSYMKYIFGI